jgi:two-component system chemotaxis sensor kinase CheA
VKPKDEEFRRKLMSTFAIEAREHVQVLSSLLLELENPLKPERTEGLVETAFREAHSLKGAARAVDAAEIESVCQVVENIFAGLKGKELALSAKLLDNLHTALNLLEDLLGALEKESASPASSRVTEIVQCLEEAARTSSSARPPAAFSPETAAPRPVQAAAESESPAFADTLRISAAKLDRLLLQAEELLSSKLTVHHRTSEAQQLLGQVRARQKHWARIESDLEVLAQRAATNGAGNGGRNAKQAIRNVLDFLEQERTFQRETETALAALAKAMGQDTRALARTTDGLLDETKKLRMLPFSSLLELFPRFIRNLSREQHKEVDLVLQGAEIEIDRRLLEEMKDPLIHLLRNCVDHGIELPHERVRKNKPRRGRITFAIAQKESNRVEMAISDDGRGINSFDVLAAARRRGLAAQEDNDAGAAAPLSLIFESGVSTSPIITDISGRGLGLAIARERVEKLGGTISVESEPDKETVFRIVLPLSIATFRGVLVRSSDRLFVLPLADIERIVRAERQDIRTVENRETIPVNGRTVALVYLSDVLGLPRDSENGDSEHGFPVVVIATAEKRMGLRVAQVVGEQEVLVKSLGPQLQRVRNVSGAAVLGTGQVTPILNTHDLMKSATAVTARPASAAPPKLEEGRRKKAILVVEDSITARTLLKNILQAAGYAVETAVDGVDAFMQLKTAPFDLVVSDVDMPRMNGLDLTAKIRAEQKLSDLPVVLVTALESREDRERGIEVGANAYIVKSSFEQSNLLEVVRQLL